MTTPRHTSSLKQRLVSTLTALALTAGSLLTGATMAITTATPAQAAVIGDDYPANLKSAAKDALVDPWNFYNRECTSFVAWRLNNTNGVAFHNYYAGPHWGNADNWGNAARAAGITVDNTPAIGAVAWWSSGHVTWVADIQGSNVTIEEYNYAYTGNYHTRTITASNPTGYIHIKDLPTIHDTDGDGTPDSSDKCPTTAGPQSNSGCPYLELAEPLAFSAPSGWYKYAPITHAFAVKNTSGSAVSIGLLIFAIRDPANTNYDHLCARDLVLQPGETKRCSFTGGWGSAGDFKVWPDWTDKATGAWQGYLGGTRQFSLKETPSLLASTPLSVSAPSGWYRRAPIFHTFTVKNTTSSALNIGLLIMAVRDPWNTNYDQRCAADLTLQPGQTKKCSFTVRWGSFGAFQVFADWTDKAGTWQGTLGPVQTYTLAAEPTIMSVEPLTISAPAGWHKGATIVHTFTVKNTSNETVPLALLILAVRDPKGSNRDWGCATNLTLAPSETKTCSFTTNWDISGNVTVWPDWLDKAGTWRGGLGPSQTYTIDTQSIALAAPLPIVSGTPRVGSTLTTKPGSWAPAPVTLAYQWLRNGAVISGATKITYALTAADLGTTISVRVTGKKTGYTSVTKSSPATAKVTAGILTSATPTISGGTTVGSILAGTTGNWSPAPVSLVTQWLRNGTAISGATKASYTLTGADLGAAISFRVTGSKAGYTSVAKTSTPTAKVTAAARTLTAATPTVLGGAKVGKTLTARPGTWKPAGVAFTYQWLRIGTAISGATKATYALTVADLGAAISVRVTGSKTGYTSVAKASTTTAKVAAGSLTSAKPKITGKAKVGKTLTAKPGTWKPAGISFTYQWKRNGKAITAATTATYKPTKADKGKRITVTVTGHKTGYTDASKTSKKTGKVKK